MFKLLVSFAFGLILNGTRFSRQTVRLLVKTIQKLLQLVLYLTSGQKGNFCRCLLDLLMERPC